MSYHTCPVCGDESIEMVCTGGYESDTNAGPFYEPKSIDCGHQDQITPEQWDQIEREAHEAFDGSDPADDWDWMLPS